MVVRGAAELRPRLLRPDRRSTEIPGVEPAGRSTRVVAGGDDLRRAIAVDGVPLGEARDRDSLGRDLPVWQGCRVIAEGEVFLMNPDVGDSLDGRYFGPFPASAVIGHAIPLFTDEDGEGRFVWRAPMR